MEAYFTITFQLPARMHGDIMYMTTAGTKPLFIIIG